MTGTELFNTSMARAKALCSAREYCSGDMICKLHSWGLNQEETNRIMESLIKDKFIDDVRYASAFVRDKFNFSKWGKIKINAHLRSREISGEIIKNALDLIDEEQYRRTLSELLSGHRKHVRAKNQYDLKGKLYRFATSKGYESGLVYEVINEIC